MAGQRTGSPKTKSPQLTTHIYIIPKHIHPKQIHYKLKRVQSKKKIDKSTDVIIFQKIVKSYNSRLDMCRRQYANDACNRGTAGKMSKIVFLEK